MNDQNVGLYHKFHVERTDGSSAPGGKHERCDYFVLDMTHDKHAASALRAYAESCKNEYPALAADLIGKATAMTHPDLAALEALARADMLRAANPDAILRLVAYVRECASDSWGRWSEPPAR